ncbi:MAG: hypothetical protein HYY93_02660 [Planctomycetes bacterium]|nr:hypothetical protein [Planctomycetota bacterium]
MICGATPTSTFEQPQEPTVPPAVQEPTQTTQEPTVKTEKGSGSFTAVRTTARIPAPAGGICYIIGALNGGKASKSIDALDRATGSVTHETDLVAGRYDAAGTVLSDGRILITGGVDPALGVDGNAAEIFDPALRISRLTGTMLLPRSGHQATLLPDGRVWISGGTDQPGTEVYDPVSETFSPGPVLAFARRYHTVTPYTRVVPVDGTITEKRQFFLIAGGQSGGSEEVLDTTTLALRSIAAMTRERSRHTAALMSGASSTSDSHSVLQILLAGGSGNGVINDTAELFDTASESFRNAGAMAGGPRTQHVMLTSGGTAALFGGISSVGADGTPVVETSVEQFSLADLRFQLMLDMPAGLFAFGVSPSPRQEGSSIFIVGGRTAAAAGGTSAVRDVWKLTPGSEPLPTGDFGGGAAFCEATTGEDGSAVSLAYTLSTDPGTNRIEASVPGSAATPAVFEAASNPIVEPAPISLLVEVSPSTLGVGEETGLTITAIRTTSAFTVPTGTSDPASPAPAGSAYTIATDFTGTIEIIPVIGIGSIEWSETRRTFTAADAGQVKVTGTAMSVPEPDGKHVSHIVNLSDPNSVTASVSLQIHGSVSMIVLKPSTLSPTIGSEVHLDLLYRDAHGVLVNNFSGTAVLAADPAGISTLQGSVSISAGVGSFDGTVTAPSPTGMLVLTATDSGDPTISGSITLSVPTTPPTSTVATIAVTVNPPTAKVGEMVGLDIVLRDVNGMPVSGFTGALTVATSEPGIVPQFDGATVTYTGNEKEGRTSLLGTVAGAPKSSPLVITVSMPAPSTLFGRADLSIGSSATAPVKLAILSGDDQVAGAGTTLPFPFVVQLTDAEGKGVPGVPILFSLVSGQGEFATGGKDLQIDSDSLGGATAALWRLGPDFGVISVIQATAIGYPVPSVHFDVTSASPQAGPPALFTAASGPVFPVPPGATLHVPFVVEVLDASKIPVPGVTVVFTRTSGEGVFQPQGLTQFSTSTGPTGRAFSDDYQAGTTPGFTSEITATLEGFSLPPVLFRVTTARDSLLLTAPGQVQPGAPFTIGIQAIDPFGSPLTSLEGEIAFSDSPVGSTTFSGATANLVAGQATVTGSVLESFAAREIAVTVSLVSDPLTAGTAKLKALGAPYFISRISGDGQSGVAGSPLPFPLVAQVVDEAKIGLPGIDVTFTPIEAASVLQSVQGGNCIDHHVSCLDRGVLVDVEEMAKCERPPTVGDPKMLGEFLGLEPGIVAPYLKTHTLEDLSQYHTDKRLGLTIKAHPTDHYLLHSQWVYLDLLRRAGIKDPESFLWSENEALESLELHPSIYLEQAGSE